MHYARALSSLGLITLPFALITHASNTTSTTYLNLTGHIAAEEVMSFVYAPFTVEPGCASISVFQNYSLPANNSIDLGVFSPLGISVIDAFNGSGSRGWSGGFRKNFTIGVGGATPGYDGGPIQAGEWNVVLGPYVVLKEGVDWRLDVELVYGEGAEAGQDFGVGYWRPSYTKTVYEPIMVEQGVQQGGKIQHQTETWLRGDFHMHSIYSDGRYLPSQQMENALKKDLDFIFFSEHNTDSGNNEVNRWRPAGAEDLLVCRAIEVTTRHGHWQAIGLDRGQQVEWRYTNETDGYAQAANGVRQSGALVSVNHPYTNCSRCDWTLDWDHHDAIEVWNGRWSPANELALKKWHEELVAGKKTTAIGGSDAHHPPDQNGLPTTVVRTRAKSQAAVVAGVRQGGVYLVEGPGMELDLTVKTAGGLYDIGHTVPATGGTVTLVANGFSDATASFVSETGYFFNESLTSGQGIEMDIVKDSVFVRVEVRNSTGVLLGLTNPIFFHG